MSREKGKLGGEKGRPRWWRRFWPLRLHRPFPTLSWDSRSLRGYSPDLWGSVSSNKIPNPEKLQLIMRIAYINGFGWIAWVITFFGGAFVIWTTGLPPPTAYVGPERTFIVFFIVPWIVGGFIGDRLGKRRDYRPFI